MVLIGFFWHKKTSIIWPRPLNCRPLNSMYDSPKNLSQKWENSLLLFICHDSPVTIHLSLFIHYCSLVTIYDIVHSEFYLFKGGSL